MIPLTVLLAVTQQGANSMPSGAGDMSNNFMVLTMPLELLHLYIFIYLFIYEYIYIYIYM